jgi:hypothetical protein
MGTRVQRHKWGKGWRYSLDGEWVRTRVTDVGRLLDTGDGLRNWYALMAAQWAVDHAEEARQMSPQEFKTAAHRAPVEARDAKAKVGTSLHELFELLGTGAPVDAPDELRSRVQLLADFYDRHDVDVLAAEAMVYHDTLKYVGTLDCVVELTINGQRRVLLLDLKTGGVWPEVCLQLAGYRYATHVQIDGEDLPMSALGITGAGVLALGANDWELVPVDTGDVPWSTFKHLLAVKATWTNAKRDELVFPPLPKPELVTP